MSYFKKICTIVFVAIALIVVGIWFTLPSQHVGANGLVGSLGSSCSGTAPTDIPYGGRSELAIVCCDGCVLVFIGPPCGGTFMYCPGITTLYEHYNLFPTAWQLGVAKGYRDCYAGPLCPWVGGGPIMQINGTSEL